MEDMTELEEDIAKTKIVESIDDGNISFEDLVEDTGLDESVLDSGLEELYSEGVISLVDSVEETEVGQEFESSVKKGVGSKSFDQNPDSGRDIEEGSDDWKKVFDEKNAEKAV